MKYLEILRAKLAALTVERDAALAEVETIAEAAQAEERSALTTDEDAAVTAALSKVDDIDAEITAVSERIGELEAVEARAEAARINGRIRQLRDNPRAVEREARAQLGLARADEMVLWMTPAPAKASSTNAFGPSASPAPRLH